MTNTYLASTISDIKEQLFSGVMCVFHGISGEGSTHAFNDINDPNKVLRNERVTDILAKHPHAVVRQVGVVERLHREIIELGIVQQKDIGDIQDEIHVSEYELIEKRFRSDLKEDISTIDFETPIVATRKQIDSATQYLIGISPNFVTWAQDWQDRLIETQIRRKLLPPVDRTSDATRHALTLKILNDRYRFYQVEIDFGSYAAVIAKMLGRKEYELKLDRRKMTSYAGTDIFFLERADRKHTRKLITPFQTSSGRLRALHAKMPYSLRLNAQSAYTILAQIATMLSGLIRSDRSFTGRVGYSDSSIDEIQWITTSVHEVCAPTLLRRLPDNFSVIKNISIANLRSLRDACHKDIATAVMASGNRKLLHHFYHFTHVDNLDSIKTNGLMSLSLLRKQCAQFFDISDPGVQRWRDEIEPCYKRHIHDYVPLYLNVKNPMLYVRKEIRDDLVILEVTDEVLNNFDNLFTDGNAASRDTLFSFLPQVLKDSLEALTVDSWVDVADGKRRRCAELLVYPSIPLRYINQAICFRDETAEKAERALGIKATIDKTLLF